MSNPHPGVTVHKNSHDITCLRLHWSADPNKAAGEPIHVKELKRDLSPWAYKQYRQMTNPEMYLQEFEIEAEATLGRTIFNLDEEATLEQSFPIDPKWTRRMALDPHPSVPHAFLWCATDPWGDRWYYRELWPSKSCFRFDNGKLLGQAGPCPGDEPVIRIKDYVQTLRFLESGDNPENVWNGQPCEEKIYARVIDYAARGFGQGTNDDPEQPNFQKRYEQYMVMPGVGVTSCPFFDDAKKDRDVGFEMVNAGLKPAMYEVANGVMKKRSKIHIFADKCPELTYQLKNIRREVLTPQQSMTKDPTGRAVSVRAHMGDNMRYMEMSNPVYVQPMNARPQVQQLAPGIAY